MEQFAKIKRVSFLKPLILLVAGAETKYVWKYNKEKPKIQSETMIEYVRSKGEFTRLDLEKHFAMSTGKAYWHVGNLLDRGLITKTNRKIYLGSKGKVLVIYKIKH